MNEYKEFNLKNKRSTKTFANRNSNSAHIEILNAKGKGVIVPKDNIIIIELDDNKSEIYIPNIGNIQLNISHHDLHHKINNEPANQDNIIDLKDLCITSDNSSQLQLGVYFNKESERVDDKEVIIHSFIYSADDGSNILNKPFSFSNKEIILDKLSNRIDTDRLGYSYIELKNGRGRFSNQKNGFLIKMTKEKLFEVINQAIIDGETELNLLNDTKIGKKFNSITDTTVKVFARGNTRISAQYSETSFNSSQIMNSYSHRRDHNKCIVHVHNRNEFIIDMSHEELHNRINQALLDGQELDLREETKFKNPNKPKVKKPKGPGNE